MGLGVGVKVWLVGVKCTQEPGGGGLSLDAVSVVIGVLTSLTEAVAGASGEFGLMISPLPRDGVDVHQTVVAWEGTGCAFFSHFFITSIHI